MASSSGSLPRADGDGSTGPTANQNTASNPTQSSTAQPKRKTTSKAGDQSSTFKRMKVDHDGQGSGRSNDLDLTLEPINDAQAAFLDISKVILGNDMKIFPDLKELARAGGFSFNVVTMCSGTEAPIFALKLIQNAFFQIIGCELFRFKHLFSVEIEPFKQEYIRRNTDAPVFRDVRDFCGRYLKMA